MQQDKIFDVIIIGGSYAGLAAAMALGRALRNVLIIDAGEPCNKQTPHSHNFLTNDGNTPAAIAAVARQQVGNYPTVQFLNATATDSIKTLNGFMVQLNTGKSFLAKKLILATGIKDIMPAIPGFAASWGISVLHCPYCHGYEVSNEKTGIIANGETAYELAALINNWTKDLTVFTNGESTLLAWQKEKLEKHHININEKVISELEHDNGYVKNIVFGDGDKVAVKAVYARLAFTHHAALHESLGCELTPEGYIKIDALQKTTVHGVFACGDNAGKMRTVANAVAMGTATGLMLNKELIEEEF